jgi:hypothetical protein
VSDKGPFEDTECEIIYVEVDGSWPHDLGGEG